MTLFQSTQDATYLKDRAGEYADLYRSLRPLYQSRKQTAISGTAGATSIPATRQFVDATKNFTGLLVGSLLRLRKYPDDSDNGDYKIIAVVNATTLRVESDWPWGSLTAIPYDIIYHDSFGDPATGSVAWVTTVAIPFLVIHNPTATVLTKYGFDKARDAILIFAAKTLAQYAVTPAIGDRFLDDEGREQEILDLRPGDLFTGSGIHIRWIGSSEVTHKTRVIP